MKMFIKLWRILFWPRVWVWISEAYSPRLNVSKIIRGMGYIEPIVLIQNTTCDGKTIEGWVKFVHRKGE